MEARHKEFRIICTDNEHHPTRQLAKFAPVPPYDEHGVWVGDSADIGGDWGDWVVVAEQNAHGKVVYGKATVRKEAADGPTWRFPCPSCTRDVQMTDANLSKLVLGLVAAGYASFDISTHR